jgi:hypothetical protein
MIDWTQGRIGFSGTIAVEGEYRTDQRWNGWLIPRIDAWAVVTVLDALGDEALTYTFDDDGLLVVTDNFALEQETYRPDDDGLYSLGAFAWCWELLPLPERREYVIGLPVVVTIEHGDFVTVDVDLSELPVRKVLAEQSEYSDEQIAADAELLSAWVADHDVRNAGIALVDERG